MFTYYLSKGYIEHLGKTNDKVHMIVNVGGKRHYLCPMEQLVYTYCHYDFKNDSELMAKSKQLEVKAFIYSAVNKAPQMTSIDAIEGLCKKGILNKASANGSPKALYDLLADLKIGIYEYKFRHILKTVLHHAKTDGFSRELIRSFCKAFFSPLTLKKDVRKLFRYIKKISKGRRLPELIKAHELGIKAKDFDRLLPVRIYSPGLEPGVLAETVYGSEYRGKFINSLYVLHKKRLIYFY